MNTCILSGRLVQDPEVRYTQTGKAVCNFTLAVDYGFGEHKKTSFIPHVAWEKKAEVIGSTLAKGRKIMTEGIWTQRSYETTDNKKRRVDEILLVNFEYCDSNPNGQQKSKAAPSPDNVNQFGDDVLPDEELPF